jgi:hypothetical protein
LKINISSDRKKERKLKNDELKTASTTTLACWRRFICSSCYHSLEKKKCTEKKFSIASHEEEIEFSNCSAPAQCTDMAVEVFIENSISGHLTFQSCVSGSPIQGNFMILILI